jgi:hypothetical protein
MASQILDGTTRYRPDMRDPETRKHLRSPWGTLETALAHRAAMLGELDAGRAVRHEETAGRRRRGVDKLAIPGFVYFVQAGADGPVKVGFAERDVAARLAVLQAGNQSPAPAPGNRGGDAPRRGRPTSPLRGVACPRPVVRADG